MSDYIDVLVIEDDKVITEFLQVGLKYEGYRVFVEYTGKGGLDLIKHRNFNLIITDVVLPDIDGFEVCRRLREFGVDTPVIMLTVKSDISDKVKGLDSGADDYLTKPFSFDELLARIRALLRRRYDTFDDEKIKVGCLELNTETRRVTVLKKEIYLTPVEFDLLEIFMRHPRRVFTRETLINRVLGYNYESTTNVIDVHISHLRKKLGNKGSDMIKTVHGIGYAFYPKG